jgi:DNA repair exonuclease SbcCD ATPase subunit
LVKIKAELGELKKSFDRNATDHSAAKHEDAEARAAVNEAVAQLKRVKETHNELNVLRKKLKRSEEKTAQLQSQINSEETKQKSAAGKVKQKATLLLTLALQQKQLVLQMTDSAKTVFEAGLAQAQTEKELQALTDSLKDKMSEIREFEIAHADAKAYRKVLKAQATKLLEVRSRPHWFILRRGLCAACSMSRALHCLPQEASLCSPQPTNLMAATRIFLGSAKEN